MYDKIFSISWAKRALEVHIASAKDSRQLKRKSSSHYSDDMLPLRQQAGNWVAVAGTPTNERINKG